MAKTKSRLALDADAPVLASAERVILARLDALLAFAPRVQEPEHVQEHHAMRIAAKRLRYTMEIFQAAYGEGARRKAFAAALDEVKQLQEHLGELHDADVLVPQLTEHLAGLLRAGYGKDREGTPRTGVHLADFEACQGLLTLCTQARDQREARFRQLQEHWERLQSQRVFEALRALLRAAAASEASPTARPGRTSRRKVAPPPAEAENPESANGAQQPAPTELNLHEQDTRAANSIEPPASS